MARKKVAKVELDDSYSKLYSYCIWLNEYYTSLVKAGFKEDIVLGLISERASFPEWVSFANITKADIIEHMEETEED